jgi:hypothetical protein
MAYVSAKEIHCLRLLAERFQKNDPLVFRNEETLKALGLDKSEYSPVMRTLGALGAVECRELGDGEVGPVVITAQSLQLVREIENKELTQKGPPDIVAQLQTRARQNPVLAWIIIGALVLAMGLSILDNLTSLIQRIAAW